MIKVKKFPIFCKDCIHLDKQTKEFYDKCYRYGCNARESGFMCHWIHNDNQLKTGGCSYAWKIKVGMKIKYKSILGTECVFLYCGSYKETEFKRKYILYRIEDGETITVYRDWIFGKYIQTMYQTQEQLKESIATAKEYKRKYLQKLREGDKN